jgi:biotin carboxylase
MLSWTSALATVMPDDRDVACFADKVLLVIGTGGPTRRPVFEQVSSLGLERVICLDEAINWALPYIDEWILADPIYAEAAVAAVQIHQANPDSLRIDGVITFDEFSVQVSAAIAEHLQLIGATRAVADRVRNKLDFRHFCRSHGLPTPQTMAVCGTTAACVASVRAATLTYPLIFKPQCGAGSALVRKVVDEAALVDAMDDYVKGAGSELLLSDWGDDAAFVEEFLEGPEVDIDMLIQAGKVCYCEVTDNFGTSEPYFRETGGCFPSGLADEAQAALKEMAAKVVAALGIQDGCIHFEAKVTPIGPVPIEINLRLGGAEVRAFHRAARGIDLAVEAVKIALGIPLAGQWSSVPRQFLASTNFVPDQSGKLSAIAINPGLWHSSGLVEIVIFSELGTVIEVPPEGYHYLGWLVAAGMDPEDAQHELEALAQMVNFTY